MDDNELEHKPEYDPLPVFDLSEYISGRYDQETDVCANPPPWRETCFMLAECLRATGCLVVRNPKVEMTDNDRFLDLMERYFEQSYEQKMLDSRPEFHYQVGVTPDGTEVPRWSLGDPETLEDMHKYPEEHRPQVPTGADPKWRYLWRIGERPPPSSTRFQELNAEAVVPAAFPEWRQVMDGWGGLMVSTVEVVAEMAALGLGLQRDTFTSHMALAPHLLAPTGTDLSLHHQPLNKVFAGYHYDLNFLTIHGKARYPGLYVWLRDGRRIPVKIPDGCLLLQAGKQLEWMTGGYIQAGMHEVVCSESCVEAYHKAKETQSGDSRRSLWRVSSTLFAHLASDCVLEPLPPFKDQPQAMKFPRIICGDYVRSELEAINLKAPAG